MIYFKTYENNSDKILSIVEQHKLYINFLKKEYNLEILSTDSNKIILDNNSEFRFELEYNKLKIVGIDTKINTTFHDSRMFIPEAKVADMPDSDKIGAMVTFAVYALIDYVLKVNTPYFDKLVSKKLTDVQQNKISTKFNLKVGGFGIDFSELDDYNTKLNFIEYIVDSYPQSLLHLIYLPNSLKVDESTLDTIRNADKIGML